MHISRPHLTAATHRRTLWAIFACAIIAEAGIALHAFTVHDAVTSGLVVSAWTREYIIGVIEHISESLA